MRKRNERTDPSTAVAGIVEGVRRGGLLEGEVALSEVEVLGYRLVPLLSAEPHLGV